MTKSVSKRKGRRKKAEAAVPKKSKPSIVQITGPWSEIDTASCMRCKIERRLYSPIMEPKLKVCAPCSQTVATSSLPTMDEDEEGDTDNIWLRTILEGPEEKV